MILGFARHYKRILAAGLIATAGAFIGQRAAQSEVYFPCSSVVGTAVMPSICELLPTTGVGTPAINPIKITTTDSGLAGYAASSVVTITGGGPSDGEARLVINATNATFSNAATGAPITVTGVADGVNPFDAVNFRQLQATSNTAYSGVASIAAMSNIPALDTNKKFGIGIGYGNFQGTSALAVGINGRLAPSLTAKVSVGAGLSYGATSVGTGLAYSW